MARWYVNPKRRKKGKVHRPRVRRSGRAFLLGASSPFKGKVSRINPIIRNAIIRNPFIREVGMRYNPYRRNRRRYRNPSIIRNPNGGGAPTLQGIMRNPLGIVTSGFTAVAAAYMTNSLPNMFGLFPGADMVSKLLRGVVRVVVGGFVYGAVRAIAPRQASSAAVGAAIGSIGATVLDLLGTRMILGYGDVVQTPGMLFAGVGNIFGAPTTAVAGYTKPMGRFRGYTRPMGRLRGYAGVYGSGSMAMMGTGTSIYG